MKACPSCRRPFPDGKRFCDECADDGGGAVRLVAADEVPAGIAIGEKTVVSGEVVGSKEEHVYQGTANITNITHVDETKAILVCGVCGLKGTVKDGFHWCTACGKDACARHFDPEANLCHTCREARAAEREARYGRIAREFTTSGGLIDPHERHQLERAREDLGLSEQSVARLEHPTDPVETWGPRQQRILDEARRLLVEQGDAEEAVARVDHLARLFPTRDDVQSLWLEALAERDPRKALAATERVAAEMPNVFLVRARLLAEQDRYQDGMDLLDDMLARPDLGAARTRILAGEAELFLHHVRATGKRYLLADAAARLAELAGSEDAYAQAVAAWLAYERGDPQALHRAAEARPRDPDLRRFLRLSASRLRIDDLVAGLQRLHDGQDPLAAAADLGIDPAAGDLVWRDMLAWIRRHVASDPVRFDETARAAHGNHPSALWLLGACSLCGIDTAQDGRAAVRAFRRGVEQGFPLARTTLALCLEHGVGGGGDADEVRRLLGEAAAQAGGWAVIAWAGSRACADEVAHDPARALALLKPLCERGWPSAESLLGRCLRTSADALAGQGETLARHAAEHGDGPAAQPPPSDPQPPAPLTGRLIRSRAPRHGRVWG